MTCNYRIVILAYVLVLYCSYTNLTIVYDKSYCVRSAFIGGCLCLHFAVFSYTKDLNLETHVQPFGIPVSTNKSTGTLYTVMNFVNHFY